MRFGKAESVPAVKTSWFGEIFTRDVVSTICRFTTCVLTTCIGDPFHRRSEPLGDPFHRKVGVCW